MKKKKHLTPHMSDIIIQTVVVRLITSTDGYRKAHSLPFLQPTPQHSQQNIYSSAPKATTKTTIKKEQKKEKKHLASHMSYIIIQTGWSWDVSQVPMNIKKSSVEDLPTHTRSKVKCAEKTKFT